MPKNVTISDKQRVHLGHAKELIQMNGVYDRIRQLRIANGLTQDELALAVGYTDRSSVAKIELGKVDLSLSKVAAIAQALHTTPKELLFPSNNVSTLDTPTSGNNPATGGAYMQRSQHHE